MSKTSTALNPALLAPKSKQILLALAGGKLSPKAIVAKLQEAGIKMSSADVTAFAGSPTVHAKWDEIARGGETSWKTVSLLGRKLVIAQKEAVIDPTDNKEKRMYVYELTTAGKKAVKELQID
jgi:DNA-binding transcriptional ArsR family regulator